MVRYNLDIAKNVLPYFIYKRIAVSNFREYFTFKIDYGFGYWLRSVRIKYPERVPADTHLVPLIPGRVYPQSRKIKLEFFDNANFKARQPEPFSSTLIASPGPDHCFSFAAPSPVDNDGYSVNFSAAPAPGGISNLNFLYKYGDIIRIDITGQDIVSGWYAPDYIDMLLVGYYVPQDTFEMYGGKE